MAVAPAQLAVQAETVSAELVQQIRRYAGLLRPRLEGLERRFQARLRQRGYDARERKALAAVTPLAAVGIIARGRPSAEFFEQVDYNGRRLAKLGLEPARILKEIEAAGRLAGAALNSRTFRWVRDQLEFAIVLALNNAFYGVREVEAEAFYGLFRAELESRSQKELLDRFLAVLMKFCRAEAGHVFLLEKGDRRLARPRYLVRGSRGEDLVLEPRWRGRYESFWSVPMLLAGRVHGVIQFAFGKAYEWLPREIELLAAAAERIVEASEKARLAEELVRREEQVRRLAAQMVQVEEAERERIGRELHDETGQALMCLRLQLEMLERALPSNGALKGGLAEAREVVERTIVEVRRLIADLSPAVLEHLGLAAALRQLVNRFRQVYQIAAELRIGRLGALPAGLQRVAYRLVQECSNNAGRHSSASHLMICLTTADEVLRLRVEDDGTGFDPDVAMAAPGRYGLKGMRERVALLGGRLEIRSRPGRGTTIEAELPVAPTAAS